MSKTEKIIGQIVGIRKNCDQNCDDRVSKYEKSCHICSMGLTGLQVKYEKYSRDLGTTSLDRSIKTRSIPQHFIDLRSTKIGSAPFYRFEAS